jgi:hypothetical protein
MFDISYLHNKFGKKVKVNSSYRAKTEFLFLVKVNLITWVAIPSCVFI